MKKLLPILLVALTGCCQLIRLEGEAYYNYERWLGHPYKATKTCWNAWFLAPAKTWNWWGLKTNDPIGTSWLTIMWPFSLIDLPCEVVCDTVMCVPDWILADPDPAKLPMKENENGSDEVPVLQ